MQRLTVQLLTVQLLTVQLLTVQLLTVQLLTVQVLTASDIHKVERRAGRSCESCSTPLPVTASKCSACQEVHYCGPECQKAHWPEHQKSCRKAPVVSAPPPSPSPSVPAHSRIYLYIYRGC